MSSLVVHVFQPKEITDFTCFPLCSPLAFLITGSREIIRRPLFTSEAGGRILSCRGTLGEKGLSRADCLELPGIQLQPSSIRIADMGGNEASILRENAGARTVLSKKIPFSDHTVYKLSPISFLSSS